MSKYVSTAAIAIGLICVLLVAAWTGDQPASGEPRLITVTGDAEVRVVPDEVTLVLGVETSDKDLSLAKSENDARVKRVLALTKEYGIEAKHVQTDHISIEPRYQDGYEKRAFIAFFVRKTITVTLRDLSRFEDLITGVLESGVTHVHGIQFRTTELRTHKDQARALAIVAAREKAEAMADALGQKVGQPLTIHEDQTGWSSWYGSWWGSSWGGGMMQNVIQDAGNSIPLSEGSLAPGQIAVNARVTVSFEIK